MNGFPHGVCAEALPALLGLDLLPGCDGGSTARRFRRRMSSGPQRRRPYPRQLAELLIERVESAACVVVDQSLVVSDVR